MFDGIQFNSLGEFLAMGGYAFNVWSVYALFAIFLVANLALPLRKRRRILREQRRRLAAGAGREEDGAADRAGWEVSRQPGARAAGWEKRNDEAASAQ